MLRLSTLYAILDGQREISPEHLMAAWDVWEYASRSACYVFGTALPDAEQERILQAINVTPGISLNELRTNVFQGHRTAEEIRGDLGTLLTEGLIRQESTPTRGRPRTGFFPM
jgi:hypothetical protein